MTGKHLYKITPCFLLLSFLFSLHLTISQAFAAPQSLDRQSLLVEFLKSTDREPQWADIARLASLEQAIRDLSLDGLDPEHYQLTRIQTQLRQQPDTLTPLSAVEDALISGAYLEAIADLMLGRTRHSAVEVYLDFQQPKPNLFNLVIDHALNHLNNPEQAFALARPNVAEYQNLRLAMQALLDLTPATTPLPPILPERPSLRVGMVDPRVVLLRQHLHLAIPDVDADLYDQSMSDVVKDFQQQQGLEADGIAGPQTFKRLNRTPQDDLNLVKVNLERWRRVNPALTPNRVIANIPSATLEYYQDNQRRLDTRTQVGRKDRKTPLMISQISHFTLNPTWTIPPTIFRQDKLPAIQNDLSYIDSNRLTVLDTQGNVLDPEQIDWHNPGAILLRQAAGPHNALGQVVIRFPNQQSIYLHDTPNQRLFERQQRFFSSGCIRVEAAKELVALLLEENQSSQAQQLDSLLSSGTTRNIRMDEPISIILGYWTTRANAEGKLEVFTDIYELDPTLLLALQG